MIWQRIVDDWQSQPNTTFGLKQKQTKVCMDCQKELLVENFYFRKGHGYKSRCKSCFMKREKARKQAGRAQ